MAIKMNLTKMKPMQLAPKRGELTLLSFVKIKVTIYKRMVNFTHWHLHKDQRLFCLVGGFIVSSHPKVSLSLGPLDKKFVETIK